MIEADSEDGDSSDLNSLAVVILAAGNSSRMRSSTSKVLHNLAGVPVIEHVIRAAESLCPEQIIVIINRDLLEIQDCYSERAKFVIQPKPLGTANATAIALERVDSKVDRVLVMYGDVPLLKKSTLKRLLAVPATRWPLISMLTFVLDDPGSYGRVKTDAKGEVIAIVEAADDSDIYSEAVLLNSGIYCIDAGWLKHNIKRVNPSASGEYYLTDVVDFAANTTWDAERVTAVMGDYSELIGVDDRMKLAEAEQQFRERINSHHLRSGITLIDPSNTYINIDVQIGEDTIVEPNVFLKGSTRIGRGCLVAAGSVLDDAILGDEVIVRHSTIESSTVGDNVDVGPYAHIREGTLLCRDVHVGNYVETKNADIGERSKIGHFSYIGDATLGSDINIGAGTITCNYDGTQKHQTIIRDGVFIGCDTMLIAPVTVGEHARTGAGSVVTRDVPAGATVVGMPARAMRNRKRSD